MSRPRRWPRLVRSPRASRPCTPDSERSVRIAGTVSATTQTRAATPAATYASSVTVGSIGRSMAASGPATLNARRATAASHGAMSAAGIVSRTASASASPTIR